MWSLTPLGDQRADELLGEVDYARVQVGVTQAAGAEFAHANHPVLHHSFAPPRWQQGIARMLDQFPFDTNVFFMTRFPTENGDPLQAVINVLRRVLGDHGLDLHLASDRQLDDDLLGNIGAHMWACRYGIGLLEARDSAQPRLNYNVLIELGGMLLTGRRCAILKDRSVLAPPTDLAGQIFKPVDLDDLESVGGVVHSWIRDDLALGECENCPTAPASPRS